MKCWSRQNIYLVGAHCAVLVKKMVRKLLMWTRHGSSWAHHQLPVLWCWGPFQRRSPSQSPTQHFDKALALTWRPIPRWASKSSAFLPEKRTRWVNLWSTWARKVLCGISGNTLYSLTIFFSQKKISPNKTRKILYVFRVNNLSRILWLLVGFRGAERQVFYLWIEEG